MFISFFQKRNILPCDDILLVITTMISGGHKISLCSYQEGRKERKRLVKLMKKANHFGALYYFYIHFIVSVNLALSPF